jgi:uncharacterized small protein (DUF1192 family)
MMQITIHPPGHRPAAGRVRAQLDNKLLVKPLRAVPSRTPRRVTGLSPARAVVQPQRSEAERFVEELQLEEKANAEANESIVVGSLDELRARVATLQSEVRVRARARAPHNPRCVVFVCGDLLCVCLQ